MTTEYEFSDSTILWGQYAQSLLVTERTLNAIQSEQTSGQPVDLQMNELMKDHQDPAILARRHVIDERHQHLVRLLEEHRLNGLILSRPENLSWLTAASDLNPGLVVWRHPVFAYVTPTHRMIICDTTQSARLFEEELFGLGFLLKEFPLADGPQAILSNLVSGKQVAWDMRLDDRPSLKADLYNATQRLSDQERASLRRLGKMLALCVETTAATFKRNESEREIAAQLVHRMIREGITPIHVQVLSESRARHYRSAAPRHFPVNQWGVISVTGRRDGLDVSMSRCVAFGTPPLSFIREYEVAAMAQTTGAFFTRPEESVGVIAPKVRRILEKHGFADEWGRESSLAGAGRPANELPSITQIPNMAVIANHSAWAWQSVVGASRVTDTIVTDAEGYEVITVAKHSMWPMMEISVKGQPVRRPSFLKREN